MENLLPILIGVLIIGVGAVIFLLIRNPNSAKDAVQDKVMDDMKREFLRILE